MRNGRKALISTWASPLYKGGLGGILLSLLPIVSWAMSAPGGEGGKGAGGGLGLFMPMILVFLIFYFLLIRPQAKQQKKHAAMLSEVKRGDEVVTASGIFGKITSVTDATVGVEIAENVRIKLDKKQVAQVLTGAEPAEKKDSKEKKK